MSTREAALDDAARASGVGSAGFAADFAGGNASGLPGGFAADFAAGSASSLAGMLRGKVFAIFVSGVLSGLARATDLGVFCAGCFAAAFVVVFTTLTVFATAAFGADALRGGAVTVARFAVFFVFALAKNQLLIERAF